VLGTAFSHRFNHLKISIAVITSEGPRDALSTCPAVQFLSYPIAGTFSSVRVDS